MFKSLTSGVRALASDAYSSLTTYTDPSGHTATVEEGSIADVDEHHCLSSPTEPIQNSMSAGKAPYTRSVARFLDAHEEEVEGKQAQRTKERGRSVEKHTAKVLSRPKRYLNSRSPDGADENRVLGVPGQFPADATQIATPMSRQRFVTHGLAPCNTLDQPKSSKAAFLLQHRSRLLQSPEPRTKSEKQTPAKNKNHENNHDRPNKRVRTGPSPVKGTTKASAIELDDSQDTPMTDKISDYIEHAPMPSPDPARAQNLTRTTISVNISASRSEPQAVTKNTQLNSSPTGLIRMPAAWRSDSPDELLGGNLVEEVREQDMLHIEDNRAQSVHSSDRLKGQKYLDDMLASSPLPQALSRPRKSSTTSAPKHNSGSRMEHRLHSGEESPDAIQGDSTTRQGSCERTSRTPKTGLLRNSQPGIPNAKLNGMTKHVKLARGTETQPDVVTFPLKHFILYKIPPANNMVLRLHRKEQQMTLEREEGHILEDPVDEMRIKQIVKVQYASEGSEGRIVVSTNASTEKQKLYYHFTAPDDVHRFYKILAKMVLDISFEARPEGHLTKVFDKAQQRMHDLSDWNERKGIQEQSSASTTIQASKSSTVHGNNLLPGQPGDKRTRMVDKLDRTSGVTIISGADRSGLRSEHEDENVVASKSSMSTARELSPDRQDALFKQPNRITRSQRVRYSDPKSSATVLPAKRASAFDQLQRWRKPLVYPLIGKKRETVQFDDLQRLDDDEFLNDNLVCLFLRYLEEHADQEQMKKIHFFNSFLFEALTKDSKAKREINYDSVKRWTTKVDLFSRDFVVVPVNENLHWFVMIICNLSYFRSKHAPKPDEERNDCENIHSIQPMAENMFENSSKPEHEETVEASTRDSFAELSLDDHEPLTKQITPKSPTTGRGRRKPRKSLQRYDVDKPIIITLDSLDQARSTTASLLRQYIVAEAKDKKGWIIDGNEIKGMTAKGIPHQQNFSDCGLYLCMYLEQFILDPFMFVRRILQRDHKAGWPDHIESSDLRDRLRKLLLNLHQQQHLNHIKGPEIPPLGSILVEMDTPNIQDSRSISKATIRTAKERWLQNQAEQAVSSTHSGQEEAAIDSFEEWKDIDNRPITVEDDIEPEVEGRASPKRRTSHISDYFRKPINSPTLLKDSTDVGFDNPQELTLYLRRTRSPDRGNINEPARTDSPENRAKRALQNSGHQVHRRVASQDLDKSFRHPIESPSRKGHHKFKKVAQQTEDTIEIDDVFNGFSDHEDLSTTQRRTSIGRGAKTDSPSIWQDDERRDVKQVEGPDVQARSARRSLDKDSEMLV